MDLATLLLAAAVAAAPAAPADPFYEALLGAPDPASPRELLSGPGRYVGRAVRTRGRLDRAPGRREGFQLTTASGVMALKLEPEAAGLVAARAAEWLGREVHVDGLFHREADAGTASAHALRAWRVVAVDTRPAGAGRAHAEAPLVALEDLVYARGGKDGQLMRVRGVVRGPEQRDLPEATRRRGDDWVLKDGYFVAWVGGRRPPAAVPVEVVGVPSTANGVVRVEAREVAPIDPALVTVARPPIHVGPQREAIPPRVCFTHPGAHDALGARGHVILQFTQPMDPTSLRDGVRARYEGAAGPTRVALDYRDRHRALVITPEDPPQGRTLVVELLDVVVDVGGRGLVPREGTSPAGPLVEEIRFPGRP